MNAKEELERIIRQKIGGVLPNNRDWELTMTELTEDIIDAGFIRKEDVELDEEKIRAIFLNLAKRTKIDDQENPGHWRWAWIIDYYDLARALATSVKEIIKNV